MKPKKEGGVDAAFYKKLFSLVLPLAFQQFMLAAVSASDALMRIFTSEPQLISGGQLCRLTVISGVLSGLLLVGLTPVILKVTVLSPQATFYLKWTPG